MERGRTVRRIAWATLLVVVLAGVIAAARHAIELSRSTTSRAAPATSAGPRDAARAANPAPAPSRRRSREGAAAEAAEEPSVAEREGAPDALRRGPTEPGAADAAHLRELALAELARDDRRQAALLALPASPDVDPLTRAAAAVAPGRPPELGFATFVARGADAVDRAAAIVGVRRPQVEDGVPVSLSGRVTERDGGAPVAGARVVVTSTFYVRRYLYDHHLSEVARAETDADGAYRIERLNADPAHFGEGGRLFVTVTAEGHAPALAVALATVTPGVANKVPDIALLRGSETLRGRVVDSWEGRPVAGARILATGAISPIDYPKDERAALFVGAPTATTDADGRFVLEGLGPGVETISAHGGDDCIGWDAVVLPLQGEFTLRSRQIRGHIEGTTVDEDGDPVALVAVEGGANSTHSFADGRFVLENFRGDTVTIAFSHPDYAPVTLTDVRDGTASLLVRLAKPRPRVVLRVHDPDSLQPVKRVTLVLKFAPGAGPPHPTSPVRLAADGRYEVRLPEGATSVAVAAEGRTPADVPLAGRADGDVIDVPLPLVAPR